MIHYNSSKKVKVLAKAKASAYIQILAQAKFRMKAHHKTLAESSRNSA
jgi:hypothetical protein